jgi:hypothetical protein
VVLNKKPVARKEIIDQKIEEVSVEVAAIKPATNTLYSICSSGSLQGVPRHTACVATPKWKYFLKKHFFYSFMI